jgi:hypothetical protein
LRGSAVALSFGAMSASRQQSVKDVTAPAPEDASSSGDVPSAVSFDSPAAFASATHRALFEDAPSTCDVCGERVPDDEDTGPVVAGRGVYVWTRGDETRREDAPLCPSCAAALGLTALARWEIDEEEG